MLRQGWVVHLILVILLLSSLSAFACTGIQLKTNDGAKINGRTMEFGMPLDLSVIIIPHNYAFQGTLPDDTGGLIYRARYAAVGSAAFGENAIMDGINEKGLSVAVFYFPGYASYAPATPGNKLKALSPTEFPNWILTQFTNIDEVKSALKNVVIVATTPKKWPGLPPFHYIVYDSTGNSLVIEPIHGKLIVYNNPVGVLTNSPSFKWQETNLSNYINTSPINPGPTTIKDTNLAGFSKNTGLHGLPGDFTSPSRFIRAAIFSNSSTPAKNADAGALQAFQILNQFDIPEGFADNGKTSSSYTTAITVKDTKNLKYYFKTHDNTAIRMIDLSKINKDSRTLKIIPMSGTTPVTDVTNTAQ